MKYKLYTNTTEDATPIAMTGTRKDADRTAMVLSSACPGCHGCGPGGNAARVVTIVDMRDKSEPEVVAVWLDGSLVQR